MVMANYEDGCNFPSPRNSFPIRGYLFPCSNRLSPPTITEFDLLGNFRCNFTLRFDTDTVTSICSIILWIVF